VIGLTTSVLVSGELPRADAAVLMDAANTQIDKVNTTKQLSATDADPSVSVWNSRVVRTLIHAILHAALVRAPHAMHKMAVHFVRHHT
jgi:hypothetical protein